MSVVENVGRRETFAAALGSTSATDVYTVPEKAIGATFLGIQLCNVDGTAAVDVTVSYYDGATSFPLLSTYSLAQDTAYHLETPPIWLEPGNKIQVTAGAADDLVVVGAVNVIDGR